jgi:HTH-type transcriptional regulator, sugar sensing transcriptional regulator
MSIDLLQEIGLNKYEAEAYYTLLTEGPLTGYELGKRSQVPLSRSYDVLERLSQKGLALAQPGEPARYLALEPALFLGQVRSTMENTLNTLAGTLTAAQQATVSSEFWVVRGRRHILARAQALCAAATRTIYLALPEKQLADISASLTEARQRGVALNSTRGTDATTIGLLIDDREALLGTLAPEDSCQAVFSNNPALIAALTASFAPAQSAPTEYPTEQQSAQATQPDWLEWENRKQQRLYKSRHDQRIA